MEKSELERLRKVYLESLEALNETMESPWIEPDALAEATGSTISEITNVMSNFDDFVENSRGKISTRKFYDKKTSFLKKLKDNSTGIIE